MRWSQKLPFSVNCHFKNMHIWERNEEYERKDNKVKRSRETWSPVEAGAKVMPKKNILWPADGCCKKTLKNTMFSSVFAKRHYNDKQESRVSRKCHRDPPKKVNKTISLFKQKLNPFPVSLYYSVTYSFCFHFMTAITRPLNKPVLLYRLTRVSIIIGRCKLTV